MKLLLQADITKLGYYGDVVDVAEGYGRNYLLPQGLAIEPTEANIKAIEDERKKRMEERQLARERLLKVSEAVNGKEVTVGALANDMGHLFGSVGEEEIAAALRDEGYEVQKKHVMINEHFRMLGTYEIKLRFGEDVDASVKLWIVRPSDQENQEGQADDTQPDEQDGSDQ